MDTLFGVLEALNLEIESLPGPHRVPARPGAASWQRFGYVRHRGDKLEHHRLTGGKNILGPRVDGNSVRGRASEFETRGVAAIAVGHGQQ